MFQGLVFLLTALTVTMIACVGSLHKQRVKNRREVVHLIGTAILTTVCYTAFILVSPRRQGLAVFLSSVYFVLLDWLAVRLMLFAASYTQILLRCGLPRRVVGFLAGADSVSLLLNTITRHMYDLQAHEPGWWGKSYWVFQIKPPHVVHRVFIYSVVLYSLAVFCYRLIKAPGIYKRQYWPMLFQTALAAGVSAVCSVWHTEYDYSVLLYPVLALSISFSALYVAPRKLMERINQTIVEDSFIGLFAYDKDRRCMGVNQIAMEFFALRGGDVYDAAEEYLRQWREEYGSDVSGVVGADRIVEQRNGKRLHLYVTYQSFLDQKGRFLGSCFRFEDRTEVMEKLRQEQYRATHDLLTGLLNRSAFEEKARRILSKTTEPYYMICTKIRDFKLINELYGSKEGDRLLLAQAKMIRETAVEEESANTRIYADKFCSLMPKKYFDEADFLESTAAAVASSTLKSFRLHYYIGVYEIQDVNEPIWTMYDKANMAINAIQGDYEQMLCYFREEMMLHKLEEREILGEFDKALAERQFHMFLQPQIGPDGDPIGAEALVRWSHPEKGMINPGLFIPTLERAGLIHRMDLFMWESAAIKLQDWKRQGWENLSISVNISPKDFSYIDVCGTFRSLLERYDFDVRNLKLEITETALMENVQKNLKALEELHEMGFSIEIDDFGTGYSSLGMLKDVRADILKLDMIFLRDNQNMERNKVILKNIIAMAEELGMLVITEGVETRSQVEFLQTVGCNMFQGYYFAMPMSAEDFEENLKKTALTRR